MSATGVQLRRPVVASRVSAQVLLPTIAVLFFLSGMAALIYQVLWLRRLGLVFGVTTFAAGTVLASFFAGLALGSLVVGKLVDRARRPLLWFGAAEVLVGLSALGSTIALDWVQSLYVEVAASLPSGLAWLTFARFALSFAVLIVPTTLMGATLPIVIKSALGRADELGGRVGLLYGTNTAGAIAGAGLAGFVLIGDLGIAASFRLAAGINVTIGLAALLASGLLSHDRDEPLPSPPTVSEEVADIDAPQRTRRLVLLVFALSGFASLALEVVWFRVLALYLDSTTYSFTLMLCAVLSGIAIGSYLVTPLLRRRDTGVTVLALLQLAIAILAVLSPVILALGYGALGGGDVLAHGEFLGRRRMLAISMVTMFPATLLLGVAFPIGLRIWAGGRERVRARAGEEVGRFYSVNVLSGVLGSAGAAFVLVPLLGSRTSLTVVAAVFLVSGLVLLTATPHGQRRLAAVAGTIGFSVFVVAAVAVPSPFSAVLDERYPGETVLFRDEGVQSTTSVQQRGDLRVLYVDGRHQSNDGPDGVTYHRRLGHLAMSLHPAPRRALVVGLGAGATSGAVSTHAGATVDVVELSKGVTRAADYFSYDNYDVLKRPNVHLRVDDGRNFLLLTDTRYDVITADIILPYHAGAGNLYSADYYRLARDALADDGLMLQWIPPGTEAQYKLQMRAFLSAFPNTTLWEDGTVMVGTKRPLRISRSAFERKLQSGETRVALGAAGLSSFDSLRESYVAGPEELRRFAGSGPMLTDDRPQAEYFLSLPSDSRAVDTAGLQGDVDLLVDP